MKTTLLLIRHGESQANLEKKFAGHWDIPLTERGEKQAELTAKYIAKTYKVDKIYSSDLIRAFSTAKALSILTGIEVIKDDALREIKAGEWERKTFTELALLYPDTYLNVWKKDIGKAICDGGESVAGVGSRVYNKLLEIVKENEGKTIAIATHATPIRTALCIMEGKNVCEASKLVWASNASVTEVSYSNNKWEIVDFSHDSHLESEKTVLPPSV
jgi:broad specificity phosphatase PhoE